MKSNTKAPQPSLNPADFPLSNDPSRADRRRQLVAAGVAGAVVLGGGLAMAHNQDKKNEDSRQINSVESVNKQYRGLVILKPGTVLRSSNRVVEADGDGAPTNVIRTVEDGEYLAMQSPVESKNIDGDVWLGVRDDDSAVTSKADLSEKMVWVAMSNAGEGQIELHPTQDEIAGYITETGEFHTTAPESKSTTFAIPVLQNMEPQSTL